MIKKRTVRKRAWNKGIEVGQKDAFTPDQVKRIRNVLASRGDQGLRDLALFSVAIDTMLQGPELLNLTVTDVRRSDGNVRSVIEVARRRGKPPLRSALSKVSANSLRKWINKAGKKRTDYIFSGRGNNRSSHPITVRQMSRLLRDWVSDAGLDPEEVRHRILTADEGSPHLEWDRRYRNGPGAVGTHEDRVHSALPTHRQKVRPNRNISSL